MRVNNTRGLPAEYQEVEYIESSGTQYIDTGLFASNDYQTETKVETTSTETEKCLFGSLSNTTTSNSWNYYNLINYLNQFYWGTGYGGSFPSTAGVQYEIVFNNSSNKVVVDGSIIGDCTGEVGYAGSTLCISARGGTNQRYYGKYKYFYFKVYDKVNEEYIRDLVPCYRKADDAIGMYDVVNDVFYTNSGTGTFTKGADVPDMVEKLIRPIIVQVNDYIPVMDSNSQDGFTASGSNTLGGTDDAWLAFHPSVEGGTDYTWHSPNIGNKQWVYTQIHIPDSIIVNGITIGARKNWSGGSQNARPIYGFKLEGSNDGTNRTEIHSETALSWTRGEVKDWAITGQTTAYTWLKLNVQSTNSYVAFDFWNVNGLVK